MTFYNRQHRRRSTGDRRVDDRRTTDRRQGSRREGWDRRHADRRGFALDPVAPPPPPPPPPAPSTLPVPAGLMLVGGSPYGFPVPIPRLAAQTPLGDGSGWQSIYNGLTLGWLDAALGVLTGHYLKGFSGIGIAPGTAMLNHAPFKRHWTQFGLQWSPNFQQHPAGMTKTHYPSYITATGGIAQVCFEIYGPPGGPYIYDCMLEIPGMTVPKAGGGTTVRLSEMPGALKVPFDPSAPHVVTTDIDQNAGTIKAWIDGTLVINASGLVFPAGAAITISKIYMGWGGTSNTVVKNQDDWMSMGVGGAKLIVAGA